MTTIHVLVHLARRDRRYWQFPLALAVLSGGSVPLSAWLMEATLPAWLLGIFALLFAAMGALVAWWLLLGSEKAQSSPNT